MCIEPTLLSAVAKDSATKSPETEMLLTAHDVALVAMLSSIVT